MRVLRVTNEQQDVVNYPRLDMQPMVDLEEGIKYYTIKENILEHDIETEYLVALPYELTEQPDDVYTHLKVANRNYSVHNRESIEVTVEL
jgi:hypothetical protein